MISLMTMHWKKTYEKPTPQDLANATHVIVPMSVLSKRTPCLLNAEKMRNTKKWHANDCALKRAQSNTNSTLRIVHCYVASKNNTPTRLCTVHKKSRSRNVMTPWVGGPEPLDDPFGMVPMHGRAALLPRSTGGN